MVEKRRGKDLDLPSQPTKRVRNDVTELTKGKYFVVRAIHGGEHCIFDDYERCKPYLNRKDASVVAFDTMEDAEKFAKLHLPDVNVTKDSSSGKDAEGLNDTTTDDLSDHPEVVNAEQSDDQIGDGINVEDDIECTVEPSSRITVYANGTSTKSVGNSGKMGFGIYFDDESPHNYAGCVEGSVSAQRADLLAALEAIKLIFKSGIIAPDGDIDLWVNSHYVKSGFGSWMKRWKANGWRNANKGVIKNEDLWKEVDSILALLEEDRVRVNVTSAPGSHGSFSAGRLAEKAMRE